MIVTAEYLKSSGRLKDKDVRSRGVWEIDPPLPLRAISNGRGANIAGEGEPVLVAGQVYHASKWSEDGKYRDHLHFNPEMILWWPMDNFEIVEESK